MTLEVIKCEETSSQSNCFLNYLKRRGLAISSLEKYDRKRAKTVVVGKVIKVLSLSTEAKFSTIFLKEYLPNQVLGENFEAVVHNKLSFDLANCMLCVGDCLAFYEPSVFLYCAFQTRHNRYKPKYLLETGVKDDSLIWCFKLQKNGVSLPNNPQQKKDCPKTTSLKTNSVKDKNSVHEGPEKVPKSAIATNKHYTEKLNFLASATESNKNEVSKNCDTNVNPLASATALNYNLLNKNCNIYGNILASTTSNNNEVNKNCKTNANSLSSATASNSNGEIKNCNINVNILAGAKSNNNEVNKNCNTTVNPLATATASNNNVLNKDIGTTVKPCLELRPNFSKAGVSSSAKPQNMNSQYNYTSLALVGDAKSGNLKKVNLFGIVHLVVKPLTKTNNGKFTIICKLLDETIYSLSTKPFMVHFFTKEDTLLKQIEHGDVLRLHRVQIEKFKGVADGRIFNSTDVTLFKKKSGDIISLAMMSNVTDSHKKRVQELKNFYTYTIYPEMLRKVVPLSTLTHEGDYNVLCQLVSDPELKGNELVLQITDGTYTTNLNTCKSWQGVDNIVTDISVPDSRLMLVKFKAEDTVLIHDVKAMEVDNSGKFTLIVDTPNFYILMDKDDKNVHEIKQRIADLKTKKGQQDKDAAVSGTTGKDSRANGALSNSSPEKREQSTRVLRKRVSPQDKEEELKNCPISASKVDARLSTRGKSSKRMRTRENRDEGEENAGGKTRKALFTANNADWSDATDEVSVTSNPHKSEIDKDTEVKNPGNVSMDTIAELLVTKYCLPRKMYIHEQDSSKSPAKGEEDRSELNHFQPVVNLRKLPANKCHLGNEKKLRENVNGETKGHKRLGNQLQEVSDDASTILNVKRTKRLLNNTREKRHSNENRESIELSDNSPAVETLASLEATPHPGEKVTSWLSRLGNNTLPPVDSCSEELDLSTTNTLVFGDGDNTMDMSSYLHSLVKRFRVFLLDVVPDLDGDPDDFVSGYCDSGCRNLYMFSVIHWVDDSTSRIPLCPSCIKLQQERELELMFMFQIIVLGMDGNIERLTVCREHGEIFFNCSVRDYLRDAAISGSRLQLLGENSLKKSWNCKKVLPMDITLCEVNKEMCVVNTRLLPPSC